MLPLRALISVVPLWTSVVDPFYEYDSWAWALLLLQQESIGSKKAIGMVTSCNSNDQNLSKTHKILVVEARRRHW